MSGEGRQHPVGGGWVVSGWLVVGKWAEHAWVSGQPVRLSARTPPGSHRGSLCQPSEDMDDDYPAEWTDSQMRSSQILALVATNHPTDYS